MPQATFHFPTGFMWGCATAAYQVEGSNTNSNWSYWEAQPGRILNGDRSGLACDWWGGRWRQDFDRAAEAGQNAHRLSVEWSRIQPTPEHWDEDALDYYRQMVRGLVERGLTPMVTLHHFTDPLWLYEQGGWENAETPAKFVAFAARVVEALKEYVTLWVTVNEPNVYAYSGYLDVAFPPGKNDMGATFNVLHNLLRGHAGAYAAIHSIQPQARVGVAHHLRLFFPARRNFPPDVWMARFVSTNFNNSFARAMADGRLRFALRSAATREALKTQDFIGVNYYTGDHVTFTPLNFDNLYHQRTYPKDAELSGTGYIANLPAGMFDCLKWAKSFDLPIIITENGVEDAQDRMRPSYLVQHLHQVWRAVNLNYPVKGYFHWTLVDNFEWERGWSQRFGLWGLDTSTQARLRRPSVDLYAAICKENGISSEMVEKFVPALVSKLFPG